MYVFIYMFRFVFKLRIVGISFNFAFIFILEQCSGYKASLKVENKFYSRISPQILTISFKILFSSAGRENSILDWPFKFYDVTIS